MTIQRRFDSPHVPRAPHLGVRAEDIERLRHELAVPEVSLGRLARMIEESPGLERQFLRHVNGALFGLSRTVTSVRHAAALLGVRRLEQFVSRLGRDLQASTQT